MLFKIGFVIVEVILIVSAVTLWNMDQMVGFLWATVGAVCPMSIGLAININRTAVKRHWW